MNSESFQIGQKVPKTGVYYCELDDNSIYRLNITEGVEFPLCEKSEKKDIQWIRWGKEKKELNKK